MRQLPLGRRIVAVLCVPLVAACIGTASATPAVSPRTSALATLLPGKQVPPTLTLDPAMAVAVVDEAGVTRSGTIWVIRGDVLAISTDLGALLLPLGRPKSRRDGARAQCGRCRLWFEERLIQSQTT